MSIQHLQDAGELAGGLEQFSNIPGFGDLSGFGDASRLGLPDEAAIQQLANEFFKAGPVPSATQAPIGAVPSSVAGSGISPSAVNQGNSVDLKDPQTSLPDPHFAEIGRAHV